MRSYYYHGLKNERLVGEFDDKLDVQASATLFIGIIQDLVMQSLLAGEVGRIHRDVLKVFVIYQSGIRSV